MTPALHTAIVSAVTQKALKATESKAFEISTDDWYVDGTIAVKKEWGEWEDNESMLFEVRSVAITQITMFTEEQPNGLEVSEDKRKRAEQDINDGLLW